MSQRSETSVESDPRLAPYRHLKRTNLTRWSGRFIAEGAKVVERLIASPFEVESVLVSERRRDFLAHVPEGVATIVLPQDECERLTGFDFHQGVLACGVRRPSPSVPELLPSTGRVTVAVAPRITDPDNLGTLIRLAAGFGLDAVVLGPGSADPFSRRTLRVSMGESLRVPLIESPDFAGTVHDLQTRSVQLAATVLDPDAEPLMTAVRPERFGLLFGNEAHGLSLAEVATCDRRITIPMTTADSLNVSIAAAVFLYHFTRVV